MSYKQNIQQIFYTFKYDITTLTNNNILFFIPTQNLNHIISQYAIIYKVLNDPLLNNNNIHNQQQNKAEYNIHLDNNNSVRS